MKLQFNYIMSKDIFGIGVALVTPFDAQGEIDFEALGRLVDKVTEDGVNYLVALGTTAETPTLSPAERKKVVAFVKERNAGRLPLVVGIGGYCTADVIETIRNTDLEGVTAILSVTPYYNRPSQEGLYQHYKAIAEASPVPIILYNVPVRTGVNMLPETTLRLAREVPGILGIKEACGTIGQMSVLVKGRPKGFKIISGDDSMALPLIGIGGDGVISVAANAFSRDCVQMIRAAYEGDRDKAVGIYHRLYEVIECLFVEGNPTGVKAAMAHKGMILPVVRLPLVQATQQLCEKCGALINEHGI